MWSLKLINDTKGLIKTAFLRKCLFELLNIL